MKKILILTILLNSIVLGEKILIPELSKNENKQIIVTLKTKQIRYLVKWGDTVSGIAKKFKMSQKELMRRNNLKSPLDLKAGQLILVDEV